METGIAVFLLVFALVFFASLIFVVIGMWKVFAKAGYDGWECLVPVYNIIVLLRIVGKPTSWLFFILSNLIASVYGVAVSQTNGTYITLAIVFNLISMVFGIWSFNMLSKSFGKDEGFTVGLVLLPFIFVPILGFGKAQYLGPYGNQALFREYQDSETGFDFENNKLQ